MRATRSPANRSPITSAAVAALVCFVATSGSALDQRATWRFDDLPAGRPPDGFTFVSSPPNGQEGRWTVVRDGVNLVLGQLHQGRPGVRLAITEDTSYADLVLSARIRFMEGAQAAGLVWRYRDPDNYYLAQLDLREQDIRVYRVVAGNRTRLEDEDDLELDPAAWHVLKVEHSGTRIRIRINGVPVADARDRTFQEPGRIGLWTTGDSTAWFDDLLVEPAQADRRRGERRE